MKKVASQMIRYFMLAAGIILLLTVIIPHHHHENGIACIHMADQKAHAHEADATDPSHQHADCGGSGHTIVFNSNTQLGHSSEDHTACCLMPLFVLYEYSYPPRISYATTSVYSDKAVYIESLHDTWIPAAAGLRAPPVVIG